MRMIEDVKTMFHGLGVLCGAIEVHGFDQAQAHDELFARFQADRRFEQCLCLDSDIMVPPELVVAVCTLEEPILIAPYEMRGADKDAEEAGQTTWAIDVLGETSLAEVREGKQMMAVAGGGFGFVLIKRKALEAMFARYVDVPGYVWTSHYEAHPGLPVCGLCTPLVTEHPEGSGVQRRRGDDNSFFARARMSGLQPYALLEVPIWHDGRGGRTFQDGLLELERRNIALRKRVGFELAECPANLLGLVDVLDGAYDVHGLEFQRPPVVLDVGANVGAFAVWAGKRWPGAIVTCYEPHGGMADLCRKNAPAAEVLAVAVVDDAKEPRVKLHEGRHNQGERSIHPSPEGNTEAFTECASIYAGKLPPCDVLKIDAEGSARKILEKYRHLSTCKAVLVEWDSQPEYLGCESTCMSRGSAASLTARGACRAHTGSCASCTAK